MCDSDKTLVTNERWKFKKYYLTSPSVGIDFMIEYVIVGNPNFDKLDQLKMQIENGTLTFLENVEDFLSKHSN